MSFLHVNTLLSCPIKTKGKVRTIGRVGLQWGLKVPAVFWANGWEPENAVLRGRLPSLMEWASVLLFLILQDVRTKNRSESGDKE